LLALRVTAIWKLNFGGKTLFILLLDFIENALLVFGDFSPENIFHYSEKFSAFKGFIQN
jgi:hypothetical protein